MKRSDAVKFLTDKLFYGSLAARVDLGDTEFLTELAEKDAESCLVEMEKMGLFYCPVEKLGDFGSLRTPKGWTDESVEEEE